MSGPNFTTLTVVSYRTGEKLIYLCVIIKCLEKKDRLKNLLILFD